jgi:Extensin-like protein C-terminus
MSGLSRRDLLRASAAGGLAVGLTGSGLAGTAAHAADDMVYVPPSLPYGPLAANEKAFSNIDGTPTMYIRDGTGVRKPATFYCTFGFYDALVLWVRRLRSISASQGYPGLQFITSAGAYVNKAGQHGAGTAIDVDEISWTDGRISRMIGLDWQTSKPSELRKRYYAVDATLRAHFRWCLDRTYNTAHHDHIHADFGGLPVILGTGSSSDVGFVQAVCNEFMNSGLAVDKIWGPLTQAAFDQSRSRLGVTSGNPHTTTSVYRAWLDAVARKGFANQAF